MDMQFQQNIELSQRQILSPMLRQSLQYLQMPITELAEYLQEQSLSNPLLEVDYAPGSDFALPISVVEGGGIQGGRRSPEGSAADAFYASSRPESFSEYLMEQVNCMQQVDETTRTVCCFLIECLDSTGYLSCSLPELAGELELPLYDVEQALYLLQMLEPAGVGARDVTECLLLQLAQGKDFTATNIRMIREGLPLLAKRDYAALSPEMRKTFVKVVGYDQSALLSHIKNPTLLIWGDRDTETPLWMGQQMEKEIADSGLVVLEGGTHFAYLEQAARFQTIVRQFLLN